MFTGLFQTLLLPTRTPTEEQADAAAADGSQAVDAPAPTGNGSVPSAPDAASPLPLPAAAGDEAAPAECETGPSPVAPAATALAAILAGVGLVLAYPGHHHRARHQRVAPAVNPTPAVVTAPARGAFAPLASMKPLSQDLNLAVAVSAPIGLGAKKPATVKHPAKSGGISSPSSPSSGGAPAPSGSSSPTKSKPTPASSKSGSTKPAALKGSGSFVKQNDHAKLTFSFSQRGGTGKVDKIRLVITTPGLLLYKYDSSGSQLKPCTIEKTRRALTCPGSIRLGVRQSLLIWTNPAPDIDLVGKLYGDTGGKRYGPFNVEVSG